MRRWFICFALVFAPLCFTAKAEHFTNAIHAYLQEHVEAEKINCGIVVGIVDQRGSSIVSCGKLDNGTDQEVNGDTVFEIGSVTKTFTALLLQVMIAGGEMKLDDPVAKYLPASVRMPARHGKAITLRHLATHTSGLPREPDNLDPKRAEYPCDGYTLQSLYAFLSGYELTRDPGAGFEYSSAGIALLGQAIALKAGTNYEALVVNRICRPLKMDSTRITLTPELQARLATGHSPAGWVVPSYDQGPLAPAGALRSSPSDMLKYLAANLGLAPSPLTPLMEKAHEVRFSRIMPETDIGLGWLSSRDPQGTTIVWHNGALDGCLAFAGFDKARRRGVVVLANSRGYLNVVGLGTLLLKSEWHSELRPAKATLPSQLYGAYVGQYQRSPSQPGIGIRRQGDQLFVQATGSASWPLDSCLPPDAGELLPESETRFFERLSGTPMTFSRDTQGKVVGLTLHYRGKAFSYAKTSVEPPQAPEPPRRPVAIQLVPQLLDACVGHYEIPPDPRSPTGAKLAIWREGDHLVGQIRAQNATRGAIDIYPESETNFFLKIDGSQLTFIKNAQGEVTDVIHHFPGIPDHKGKKLPGQAN